LGRRLSRRNLLIRTSQAAVAGFAFHEQHLHAQGAAAGMRFEPHYKLQRPLDAALLKTKAGQDAFMTEKYHDRIAEILTTWREGLLRSSQNVAPIEKVLAPDFSGCSLKPDQSKIVRPGAVEVQGITFPAASIGSRVFLEDFRSAMNGFSKLLTVEFQVTRIDAASNAIRTRVRYELVGTGDGIHREQRAGFWDLEWNASDYQLRSWRATGETRSRTTVPYFADVTRATLGDNPSYASQLLHGVDYWRTILDGACGIDIYGHNGVSVGDIDGDGFDDLYVCQPGGLPNRLYRNRGDGTFEDITEASGVGLLDNTACALFIDVDNDGRQDLVVVRASGPLLFLNQGGGKFRQQPDAFRFANAPQGTFTGAAAADYDRDGWLDIYFCLYVYYQGTDQYKYPVPYFAAENGPPNFLFRNNRDGTFRDVTKETGLDKNNTRYSFCCGWSDYNRDGWPDLYVVNDFGRKNLYRNNGDGTFTDVAAGAGVEDVGAGMSVAWFDFDNDGAQDLYAADMWTAAGERVAGQDIFKKDSPESIRALYRKHAMGNSLFRNAGTGLFQDVTEASGAGMGRWAWSSDAWDFDHDGYPDLYIANGMISGPIREDLNSYFWRQVVANSPDEAKASHAYEQGWSVVNELIRADHTWSGYERNVFYANNRDGTFSDVSGAIGLDFLEDGRAFALADFDHDGRQEIFLKNRNAPQLRVLLNVMEPLPPAIAVRLKGVKSNSDAIGAVVTVGRQTRMVQAGSGFLSQHSKELSFGLGAQTGPITISIQWPSGATQRIEDIPANHRVSIEEGSEAHRVEPFRARISRQAGTAPSETFPENIATWLLVPVPAPNVSPSPTPLLICIGEKLQSVQGVKIVMFDQSSDEANVYNILYRFLFDRHRDMTLPTYFLVDTKGQIVKIYQGRIDPGQIAADARRIPQDAAQRLATALPFRGNSATYEFERNYLSFGSVFFQRGYFAEAGTFFALALRDDPSSAEALYGVGSAHLKLGKVKEARDSFERAVKLSASYPETKPNALNNLGLMATREGRTGDAIQYFQEALQLNPEHQVALQNLGSAYRQQKRFNEARQVLERALALNPEDPEVNYSLGMVFAQTGDPARAYEYLRKALEFRPAYPEALNNLGILYLRTQRRDQAVRSFEECIRVAPQFDQSYLNLAMVHAIEGHPEQARAVLLDLLKQHPDHVEGRAALEKLK
jgi:Flp pilus assembly protein TadD